MSDSNTKTTEPGEIFATTRWTVVLAAAQRQEPASQLALEELCRTYWFPLYVYVRRRGYRREDAEDLTQAFFERFLARNYLTTVSSERGRFRAFLLASLKHFLANEWDKSRTLKHGGQFTHLSLDWHTADTQFQVAGPNELTPDEAFDRQWAVTLLERVIARLAQESVSEAKETQFLALKPFLTVGQGTGSYAEVARALGWQETAVRVAVHRLRRRYRQLLRQEIAGTLADPSQAEEELRSLFSAFHRDDRGTN